MSVKDSNENDEEQSEEEQSYHEHVRSRGKALEEFLEADQERDRDSVQVREVHVEAPFW